MLSFHGHWLKGRHLDMRREFLAFYLIANKTRTQKAFEKLPNFAKNALKKTKALAFLRQLPLPFATPQTGEKAKKSVGRRRCRVSRDTRRPQKRGCWPCRTETNSLTYLK